MRGACDQDQGKISMNLLNAGRNVVRIVHGRDQDTRFFEDRNRFFRICDAARSFCGREDLARETKVVADTRDRASESLVDPSLLWKSHDLHARL